MRVTGVPSDAVAVSRTSRTDRRNHRAGVLSVRCAKICAAPPRATRTAATDTDQCWAVVRQSSTGKAAHDSESPTALCRKPPNHSRLSKPRARNAPTAMNGATGTRPPTNHRRRPPRGAQRRRLSQVPNWRCRCAAGRRAVRRTRGRRCPGRERSRANSSRADRGESGEPAQSRWRRTRDSMRCRAGCSSDNQSRQPPLPRPRL